MQVIDAFLNSLWLALCFLLAAAPVLRAEPGQATKRILFFTKSQRSEHSVIKQVGDKPSFAEGILAGLAASNHWVIETSPRTGESLRRKRLREIADALLFYS